MAAELDRQYGYDQSSPNGLIAPAQCLDALISLLKKRPDILVPEDMAPLMRLQAAIVDLGQGRPSPIFKPVGAKRGSPGKGVTYAALQGFAARALSELIEGDEDANSAAQRVAKALKKGRKDMRKVTAATVINWRERILQGPCPGAPDSAVDHYWTLLPPHEGDTPKVRGEKLLIMLEKSASFIG
jgi:hypothetical protein